MTKSYDPEDYAEAFGPDEARDDTVAYQLRFDRGKREHWNRMVKQTEEYHSVRHLIELAVFRELSDEYVPRDQADTEVDISALDGLGNLDDRFDSVDAQLTTIADEIERLSLRASNDSKLTDLATLIAEELPHVHPDNEEVWLGVRVTNLGTEFPGERATGFGRIDDLARWLSEQDEDVSKWDVQRAARKAATDLRDVHRGTDYDGKERLWIRDDDAPADPVAEVPGSDHDVEFASGDALVDEGGEEQ